MQEGRLMLKNIYRFLRSWNLRIWIYRQKNELLKKFQYSCRPILQSLIM